MKNQDHLMGNNAKKIIDYLDPIKIIGDKESDNFIENFLIGGFVLVWGALNFFLQKKFWH
ncbi:MAG: hypothetical protein Ct9H90mP2_04000 [Dehalococcoidia bacterium]|nr:MAG: hypothetical protein Ct9H90mP2_04000 [Dehalococcoidia bacterium]